MEIGTVLNGVSSAIANLGGTLVLSQLSNLIRIDHPMVMNFAVAIDGFIDSGFVKCEGLHDRATPYEIKQCNLQTRTKIYPYQRKIGQITLEKGITFQGKMESWYHECIDWEKGDPSPLRDVSIIQLMRLPQNVPLIGGQLIEIMRQELPNAVCRDLTSPQYDAKSDSGISILKSVIDVTTPHLVPKASSFDDLGIFLDALKK